VESARKRERLFGRARGGKGRVGRSDSRSDEVSWTVV
jgi:hypothetical protein